MDDKDNGLIQRLKDRFNAAFDAREQRKEDERWFNDRAHEIFASPRYITTDFWCHTCKRDCTGTGYRQVCTVRQWAPTAWFIGYCPLGHKMLRYITDKHIDPYYNMSELLRRQRYELQDTMLTPDNPRFKLLYPEQYKALMENDGKKTTSKA